MADQTKNDLQSAIRVEPVARRAHRRQVRQKITSNGTIAAGVMVLAMLLAVVTANTDAWETVHHVLTAPLSLVVGETTYTLTVEAFVNDLLMAVFFLLVGIELKYEMTVGELNKPRQAALPMLAACGGAMVPVVIYVMFNIGGSGIHGWAVPMATDIAFALGIMSLLGKRVAPAAKVFFSTLAVVDDLLAIIVIAVGYGQTPSIPWLAASVLVCVLLFLLNRAHVYTARVYLAVGAVLWVCMYNSGIHATLAGVLLALALPPRTDIRIGKLPRWLEHRTQAIDKQYDSDVLVLGQHEVTLEAWRIERVIHNVTPPLQRVERAISVPTNFIILPLFAFVNAQVRLVGIDLAHLVTDPVAGGAFFGAFLGKPIGIIGITWLLIKVGFARMPRGMDWIQVCGVGIMGGLGFTMSILISTLAFTSHTDLLAAKCAILACSTLVGILGYMFILLTTHLRHKRQRRKKGATA